MDRIEGTRQSREYNARQVKVGRSIMQQQTTVDACFKSGDGRAWPARESLQWAAAAARLTGSMTISRDIAPFRRSSRALTGANQIMR